MKYLLYRNSLLGALGATAALVAVSLARGGDCGSDATTTAPVTAAPSNSASAGMVAAKDPVTGALRAPTAEEMAALQANSKEVKARRVEPVVRQLPNGTLAITLDSSFDVYSVAAKGSDGKIHTGCVPGDKVEATLKAAQEGGLTKKEVLDEK